LLFILLDFTVTKHSLTHLTETKLMANILQQIQLKFQQTTCDLEF